MTTSYSEIDVLKKKIEELEKQVTSNSSHMAEQRKIEEAPLFKLYEWTAPDRINVRRTIKWYNTVIAISAIAIIFAILTSNYILILVIVALGFFVYVSTATPPQIQKLAVTNKGILVDEKIFYWTDIEYFWVSERDKNLAINIELRNLKGRIVLLQGDGEITKIVTEMLNHEQYREPTGLYTFISNMTDGRGKKITEFTPTSK
jgi:hypothetical protein